MRPGTLQRVGGRTGWKAGPHHAPLVSSAAPAPGWDEHHCPQQRALQNVALGLLLPGFRSPNYRLCGLGQVASQLWPQFPCVWNRIQERLPQRDAGIGRRRTQGALRLMRGTQPPLSKGCPLPFYPRSTVSAGNARGLPTLAVV